ncbi:protein GID8 homolog [Bidens hawaiensis]|uniref:protein GID8 homolog n=1 Tax=Bidens hawaiensis TaxID=980011 RepID=UPI00404AA940
MVMDFLLAHGLLPAAQAFQQEAGCPIPMDSEKLALVETQKIVKDFIFNRQFDDAIRALNEILTPAFLEARPRVRFLLEQQKMIELCRARQFDEALKFSREFIRWESVELGDDSFKKECRSTMLLMAYGDAESSPASDLLDTNRMTSIFQYVVDNMKTYHGIPTEYASLVRNG